MPGWLGLAGGARRRALAALIPALAACGQDGGAGSQARPVAPPPDDASPPEAAPPPVHPLVPAITEPGLLGELERSGLGLAAILGGGAADDNGELHAASARYRDFAAFTREDIAASIADENTYRPDWGEVGSTLHAKRRNLDPGWLTATSASFELVGVVNRMDRAPFAA